VITVAVVAGSLVSSLAYVHNWQHNNVTPDYYDNAVTSLDNADASQVPLVNGSLPQNLLWAFGFPENTFSHVFRNLSDRTQYPTHAVDKLYTFNDLGQLSLVSIPQRRVMVPGQGCGYILKAKPTTIPLDGPVIGGGWWIRMTYGSPRDFDATVKLGSTSHTMRFPAGLHTMYFQADGSYKSVVIENDRQARTACVTALALGVPAPGIVVP
jgi:hypothetical protein